MNDEQKKTLREMFLAALVSAMQFSWMQGRGLVEAHGTEASEKQYKQDRDKVIEYIESL